MEGKIRHTGVEQLVPLTPTTSPLNTIRKFSACADMSGYARPYGLYNDQQREGQVLLQALSLEQAGILVANMREVGQDGRFLILWPRKVV
jgi:hypothetical protein